MFCVTSQCNNPKTKEPKLKAAARIVPEWADYDNEIRQLLKRIDWQKKNDTQASATGKSMDLSNLINSLLIFNHFIISPFHVHWSRILVLF